MSDASWPTQLRFRSGKRALQIAFDDKQSFDISFELLRVESPSAEVQGHAAHQKKLISGKSKVQVTAAEPVGRYAVRLSFNDGHDSGIFSWAYLRELGENSAHLMDDYKNRLKSAGLSR